MLETLRVDILADCSSQYNNVNTYTFSNPGVISINCQDSVDELTSRHICKCTVQRIVQEILLRFVVFNPVDSSFS
jgi:hypothetical protein